MTAPVQPRAGRGLLFLAMYPIVPQSKAAAVRIRSLRDALQAQAGDDLTFICGGMGERRRALLRLLAGGGWRAIDRIYVEAHSTTATELECLFLLWMAARGRRVLTYVRDAYPLFSALEVEGGATGRLHAWAFRVSLAAYRRASAALGFPSQGLADAVAPRDPRVVLLPPGLHACPTPPPPPDGAFLLVGGSAGQANGVELYVEAARRRPAERFIWCGQKRYTDAVRAWALPPNLEIVNWDNPGIVAHLPGVKAFVIPRQITPYTDLCVPIKLMDYISWGRPIIATRCAETARILDDVRMGILVDDTVEGLVSGVETVARMDAAALAGYPGLAAAATGRYGWDRLATRILATLAGKTGAA